MLLNMGMNCASKEKLYGMHMEANACVLILEHQISFEVFWDFVFFTFNIFIGLHVRQNE